MITEDVCKYAMTPKRVQYCLNNFAFEYNSFM